MSGGDKSTADLVRGTQKGILVTRTWYIRMVDPQTVLLTGLTAMAPSTSRTARSSTR